MTLVNTGYKMSTRMHFAFIIASIMHEEINFNATSSPFQIIDDKTQDINFKCIHN